jgi:hypothetical protein
MPAGRSYGDYCGKATRHSRIGMKIQGVAGDSKKVYFHLGSLLYFNRKLNVIKKFNSS